MKAIVFSRYGSADVLELTDVEKPAVGDDGVLVRVRAASVNPLDWHGMRGQPYLMRMSGGVRRPKEDELGVDLAGEVEAVGTDVTQFRPGDEVFGVRSGAFGEYVRGTEESTLAPKPGGMTFEQAAAVPVAGMTALQGLRDKGQLQPGQHVLINGASGGVGTFAVQIAKAFGAEVTGVCSTANLEMVRSIGADHVIDYTRENFTKSGQKYDLILDIAGSRPLSACRRVMTASGTFVAVGGPGGRWIRPADRALKAILMNRFVSQRMVPFLSHASKDDLLVLKELIEAGKVTPVIDRAYPLSETPEAVRYLEQGHARGKVVITVQA
jgi:NADPH:quinone reductase-like Zn-dependent oxidoreductase